MVVRVTVGAAVALLAALLGCCRAGRRERVLTVLPARGASPDATDRGSEDSPMCWLASRVADQATAALNAIPSNAAIHSAARRLMVGRRYSALG